MIIGSNQMLQTQAEVSIQAHIEGKEIKRVDSSKPLGLTIDETLSWSKQIDNISKKITSGFGVLKRVRPFIKTHSATKIYQALIERHFRYCCSVWDGLSQTLNDKLQKLQNRVARVMIKSRYDASAGPLLDMLGWHWVSISRTKQKEVVMLKTLNDEMHPYMEDMFSVRNFYYNIRRSENILHIPKPRTDYLKRSLRYSGAVLWSGLYSELRKPLTLTRFKKGINDLD